MISINVSYIVHVVWLVLQLILGALRSNLSAQHARPNKRASFPVALLGLFPRLGHVETVWVFYQLIFAVLFGVVGCNQQLLQQNILLALFRL